MSMFGWNSNIDTSQGGHPTSATAAHQQQQQQQRPLRWLPPALTRPSNASSPTSSSPTMNTLRQATHIDDNPTLTTLSGSNDPSLAAESPHLAGIGVPTPQVPSSANGNDVGHPQQQQKSVDRRRRGMQAASQTSMEAPSPVTAAQMSAATSAVSVPSNSGGDTLNNEDQTTPNTKKRGRLLTTAEETTLFQICNRHASTFGQHDRLCQWWATVTDEFTSETGHPYSWHSVRRKVESVTKQRIKFLATLRESGGVDRTEEGWRKALEMWIPAWEKFQEQEAQRSAGKGWRRGRKRKTAEVPVLDEREAMPQRQHQPVQQMPSQPQPQSQPQSQPQPQPQPHSQIGDAEVQLPSGFDSIFDQQKSQSNRGGQSSGKSKSTGKGTNDSTISAALLETLSKLNRTLEARSSPITGLPVTPSQHTPLDSQNGNHIASTSPFGRLPGPSLDELREDVKQELKQELRQELREELLQEIQKDRGQMEERLDAVQRTHQMILELLHHEP